MKKLWCSITGILFSTASFALTGVDTKLLPTEEIEKMVIIFAGVIVVLIFSIFLIKKIMHFSRFKNGKIKLIAGLSLGVKERVMLLELKDTQILVGVCPGRINKIHVFEKKSKTPNTQEDVAVETRQEPFVAVMRKASFITDDIAHEDTFQKTT